MRIPIDGIEISGDLAIPASASSLIVFAHGSGSSRRSARNRRVARYLEDDGFATLLFDLLTPQEQASDSAGAMLRFDVELLAHRLAAVVAWAAERPDTAGFRIGCLGASTGTAAAIVAATIHPDVIEAIVSRGGRPDLAGDALGRLRTPTLLIVGGNDTHLVSLNRAAMRLMNAPRELVIVPRAGHLFEEPGALEQVGQHARTWFGRHLGPPATAEPQSVAELC